MRGLRPMAPPALLFQEVRLEPIVCRPHQAHRHPQIATPKYARRCCNPWRSVRIHIHENFTVILGDHPRVIR